MTPSFRPRRELLRDVTWGARLGLWFGLFYSLVSTVIVVIRGGALSSRAVSLQGLIGLYLSMGLVAGALVGLMRPVARNRLGACVVGTVVTIPVIVGIAAMKDGLPANWGQVLRIALFCSVIAGPVFALVLWEKD